MSLNLYTLRSIEFQNPNLWEFYIIDGPTNLKFLVTDTTLPYEKLETETRNTGSKHYTGFTPIEDFTITFRETTSFAVYDYLKSWQDSIFDPIKRVFKTGPGKYKTAILAFQKPVFIAHIYSKVFQFNKMKLKGMDDKSLNYNTQDAMTISASFTADEVVESNLSSIGTAVQSSAAQVGQLLQQLG